MHLNSIHSIYCFACFRNAFVSPVNHKCARARGTDEPDTTSMPSSPSDTDKHALDAMTQKVYFQLIIYLKTENNQNHQLFKGILLL